MSKKATQVTTPWPNIQELIDSGRKAWIGEISTVRCAAVAVDETNLLAALLCANAENPDGLLGRF